MANALTIKLIALAVVGGFIPPLVWLWFWLKEDQKRPEPKGLIIRAFLAGGLAVFVAALAESWLINYPRLPILLSWALVEEGLKFLLVYGIVRHNRNFDEPIDAMIYLITGALGFAAVENVLFLLKTLLANDSSQYFLLTGNLRFLGATVLHVVGSAVVGGALALYFCAPPRKKLIAVGLGLIVATGLHALFNFFIIANEGKNVSLVLLFLWLGAIAVIWWFEKVKQVVCAQSFINQSS